MLDALAFQFVDRTGRPLDPVFDNLPEVRAITRRQEWNRFGNVRIIGLTDVSSPLCGPDGASRVFGPQKGFENTGYADRILGSYSKKFETLLGVDLSTAPGAGAAGGLGFAIATLGGELRQGGMFILDALGWSRDTSRFDWIITGEGRSDRQTLLGKGPALVARLARRHGVPVTLLSGASEYDPALEAAFDGCMSMQSGPISLAHAMVNAGPLLEAAGRQLAAMFIGARRAARQPASAA